MTARSETRNGRRPLGLVAAMGIGLLAAAMTPSAWARKSSRTITGADGRPIRKVYIDAETPTVADSAVTQLGQDTCLTVVSKPAQADAVLELGMALPSFGGGGGVESGGTDSPPHPETLGKGKNKPHRSFTATCSDGKSTGGCTSTYTAPGNGFAPEPAADWTGNVGSALDVSLVSPGDGDDELWEAEERSKHSWSDQLRVAAGCPVCPGEEFNPRRDKMTYRQWMQTKCPNVLAAATR